MSYRLFCSECGNEGEADDEDLAERLVDGHNRRRHDGEEIADWEER
jgi:hypothetical protein